MKDVLLVGLGSAVGGMLRYLVGLLVTRCPATCTFPWATLVVNWGGCLLLGMFLGAVARGNPIYAEWRPLLCAGFCGGFTTFSTFSAEALALLREGETGLFVLRVGINAASCSKGIPNLVEILFVLHINELKNSEQRHLCDNAGE